MITLFCKTHKIKYKQGMNELISLFLCQSADDVDHYRIYNWFTRFMHLFVPTFYNDADFLSLQWSLGMFSLLLKYHDPEVALYLRRCKISWDIYAFSWFITLFASKLPLELEYKLLDFYVQEADCLMIFYVATAFMMFHRNEILATEEFMLPQTMANLTLNKVQDICRIFARALELKQTTPTSFNYFIISEKILSPSVQSDDL